MSVLTAERIKLTSTKSPWWCSAVVAVLGIGVALIFALAIGASGPDSEAPDLDVNIATSGVYGFGAMVLMIMATLSVTSEYRFGIIRTTFMAVPNRTNVVLTKTALLGGYAAVFSALISIAAIGVAKLAGGDATTTLTLDGSWREFLTIPLYVLLGVALAIAIGTLVRQSAAAISIIVLWPLAIEPLLGAFGSFGRNVKPFLPFANFDRFRLEGAQDEFQTAANWHWNAWGSLIYFIIFVLVIYIAALVVVNRRDA